MEITTPFLNFRDRFEERFLATISADEYASWQKDLQAQRSEMRKRFFTGDYERTDLAWYRDAVVEHFTFMYDLSVHEPGVGYKIDEFLDHGAREFGGYDIILLWHAYPRIGCDERNQFDFYREMPGGLPGLRAVVDRCHQRGARAFIDYNPWDTGTRREGKPDHEALAEIVAAIDADGIFLDTMNASHDELRAALDAVRPGVVFETEGSPGFDAAESVTGSWGHFNPKLGPRFLWFQEFPFIANTHHTMKWLEPRQSIRVLERHSQRRTVELYPAFFNGLGTVVWENIFGWWNPWSPQDRAVMRRITTLLRNHRSAFQDTNWQPLIPTLDHYVMANEWRSPDHTLWTMINLRYEVTSTEVLAVPQVRSARYYDAWNDYQEIGVRTEGDTTFIPLTIGPRSVGCVVQMSSGEKPSTWAKMESGTDLELVTGLEDNLASSPQFTAPHVGAPPGGMVEIPAGEYRWHIEHRPREGACYDDLTHCWGNTHPDKTLKMEPFLMDQFPVTNDDYCLFLTATGYEPAETKNFLKHWVDGKPPAGIQNHPVVNIDLSDARAYAAWAGKRLPTEAEWQYAAQGGDSRFWPWGNDDPPGDRRATPGGGATSDGDGSAAGGTIIPGRCNSGSGSTTAVDAFPAGASPFGVWDMAGNAWELTESERNDGHTRYVILKGGSFYEAKGSRWYFDGGAQRCTSHAKFLLMWPGLDRCSTIGFRCVMDVEQ